MVPPPEPTHLEKTEQRLMREEQRRLQGLPPIDPQQDADVVADDDDAPPQGYGAKAAWLGLGDVVAEGEERNESHGATTEAARKPFQPPRPSETMFEPQRSFAPPPTTTTTARAGTITAAEMAAKGTTTAASNKPAGTKSPRRAGTRPASATEMPPSSKHVPKPPAGPRPPTGPPPPGARRVSTPVEGEQQAHPSMEGAAMQQRRSATTAASTTSATSTTTTPPPNRLVVGSQQLVRRPQLEASPSRLLVRRGSLRRSVPCPAWAWARLFPQGRREEPLLAFGAYPHFTESAWREDGGALTCRGADCCRSDQVAGSGSCGGFRHIGTCCYLQISCAGPRGPRGRQSWYDRPHCGCCYYYDGRSSCCRGDGGSGGRGGSLACWQHHTGAVGDCDWRGASCRAGGDDGGCGRRCSTSLPGGRAPAGGLGVGDQQLHSVVIPLGNAERTTCDLRCGLRHLWCQSRVRCCEDRLRQSACRRNQSAGCSAGTELLQAYYYRRQRRRRWRWWWWWWWGGGGVRTTRAVWTPSSRRGLGAMAGRKGLGRRPWWSWVAAERDGDDGGPSSYG